MSLFLSRLRIRRDPGIDALKALIDPAHPGRAIDAHHRLIWTAFAGLDEQPRDFLWRDEGHGAFLILSHREPEPGPIFETPDVKTFTPGLAAGDRLAFKLRANATRTRRSDPNADARSQRVDVVMDRLYAVPKHARAGQRDDAVRAAATEWMTQLGGRAGFGLLSLPDIDYAVRETPAGMGKRRGAPRFGIIDMTGTLEVTDPTRFLPALAAGFGRAKAFGCGLMLIRRA